MCRLPVCARHDVDIDDFFVHVIAKDEFGLKKRHTHAGNCLETLDFVRAGLLGAAIGLFAGVVGCILLDYFGPFENIPWFVYVALCGAATLFGAWEGGWVGVEKEDKKLERFHDDFHVQGMLRWTLILIFMVPPLCLLVLIAFKAIEGDYTFLTRGSALIR